MHKRTQILNYAETLLSASGRPAGLNVELGRLEPADPEDLPLLVPTWANDPRNARTLGAGPQEERTLRLRCLIWTTGGYTELDEICTWVEKALKADSTWGGLVRLVEYVDSTPDLRLWGLPFAAGAIDFDVTYRTLKKDPEATI